MHTETLRPRAVTLAAVHADAITSAAPRVVGWRSIVTDEAGREESIGPVFRFKPQAERFACAQFPSISGWRRLGPTAFAAVFAPPDQARCHTAGATGIGDAADA